MDHDRMQVVRALLELGVNHLDLIVNLLQPLLEDLHLLIGSFLV